MRINSSLAYNVSEDLEKNKIWSYGNSMRDLLSIKILNSISIILTLTPLSD
jgi:hypothetical protein